jgi:ATP-dependent DNA ligase
VFLYGFDLLAVDDMDLRRERLDDRRAKLRRRVVFRSDWKGSSASAAI